MNNYKYKVVYSNKFKKNLKKMIKQNKNIEKLLDVVDILTCEEPLSLKYKEHNLINNKNFKNCKECHIEPDWLLIYKYNYKEKILILVNTASHSELFSI